jgi:phage baseplate assembly protein W
MTDQNPSFLGTGWSFPPEFTNGGRNVATVSGAEDVRQSLEILLGTRLEERILQEEYGSNLRDFVFGELNAGVVNSLRNMIAEAVLYNEPRVELNSVDLETDEEREGLVLIKLDYTIPASNTRFNMVYPFYLQEASI